MKNVFYHIVKDAGTIVKASRFSLANPKGSRDALPLHSESELLAAVQTLQAKFLWTLRIMLLNLFFFFKFHWTFKSTLTCISSVYRH